MFHYKKISQNIAQLQTNPRVNMRAPSPSSSHGYLANSAPSAEPSLCCQGQDTRLLSLSKHPQHNGFRPDVRVAPGPRSAETFNQSFRSSFHSPPPNPMQTTTKSRNTAVFKKNILSSISFDEAKDELGEQRPKSCGFEFLP